MGGVFPDKRCSPVGRLSSLHKPSKAIIIVGLCLRRQSEVMREEEESGMTFSLECRACGHSNRVDSSLVGKRVKCRGCGVALVVSLPRKSTGAPSGAAAHLKFNCPACGKEFAAKPELAGKNVRCSGCQNMVQVPGDTAASAERPPRRPVRTHGESSRGETPGSEEAWSSFPRVRTHGKSAKAETSPRPTSQPDRDRNSDRATPVPPPLDLEHSNYQVFTQRGDLGVIAYKGADEPDEKVESVLPPRVQLEEQMRQKAAAKADEDPALTRALAAARKRKRKTKRKAFFDLKETLRLLGGILGLVLLVSFMAWGYPYFRWPFGLILVSLGFVTCFMGIVSLQELIAEKAAFILRLFRFFPPLQWLIIATRWAEPKDFAPFFVVGALTLGLGCGFIATAPGGKKADKPAKTTRRKGQPVAQPKASPTAIASKEQPKPAASTPKAAAPSLARTTKEQAKPTGPALTSAKEQAKPTGPTPAPAKEQAKPTVPTPAPSTPGSATVSLSAPTPAQPKLQAQPLPGSNKPAGGGKARVAASIHPR